MNPPSAVPAVEVAATAPILPPPTVTNPVNPTDLLQLWILRLTAHFLVSMGMVSKTTVASPYVRSACRRRGPRSLSGWPDDTTDMVSAMAGLKKPDASVSKAESKRLMQAQLTRRIRSLEKRLGGIPWLVAIEPNASNSLRAVGQLLSLDDRELKVLAFLLMLQSHGHLHTAAQSLFSGVTDQQATEAVAVAIGLPFDAVLEALSIRSRLMSCQLVRWNHHDMDLSAKFDWVSKGFLQEMLQPGFDPFKALRDRIVQAPAPTLTWDQFSHLGELREVILSYVGRALNTAKPGVNLLLHGTPGTGKSEFSRVLAQKLGCDLYEVSSQDEDGDPVDGGRRLMALRVLHAFCAGRRTLLVFDEIEDVFPKPHALFGSQGGRYKGWMNRMLEGNPAVTIWITNSVEALDPAFVRRFDVVLEVKAAPAAVRETQLRNLPVTLSEATIKTIAACTHLSPAVVNRAATVVSAIQSDLPVGRGPQIMELIVNQTLQAQGHGQIRGNQANASIYNAAYINSDFDPVALAEGIREAKSARLCLYGPPGTGKTAYGQWLAGQLGRPITVKRSSDLLNHYVGMTEKAIAKAFHEAAEEGAVLLMDEVDSFLQERGKAQRSWEVTQVNEFLTQLEQFEGVFIATTNLMEGLDAAALRRFDLKAKFGYLKPEQARGLLEAHLSAIGVPAGSAPEVRQIEALMNLTPGDFAAVARQNRFRPLGSAVAWVAALEAECRQKAGSTRRIVGFGSLEEASA